MPFKNLGMKSSYYLLFHQDLVIYTLKIFGSTIYPFLRPYKQTKLQPRSKQCVFLSFAARYKGVVCYEICSKKLVLSSHVIYGKNIFPYKIQVRPLSGNTSGLQNTRMPSIIV